MRVGWAHCIDACGEEWVALDRPKGWVRCDSQNGPARGARTAVEGQLVRTLQLPLLAPIRR